MAKKKNNDDDKRSFLSRASRSPVSAVTGALHSGAAGAYLGGSLLVDRVLRKNDHLLEEVAKELKNSFPGTAPEIDKVFSKKIRTWPIGLAGAAMHGLAAREAYKNMYPDRSLSDVDKKIIARSLSQKN